MRTFYYILYFTILSGTFIESTAQNLVPNGSFELYDTCPQVYSKLYYAYPWFQPNIYYGNTTNSCNTDLYNDCNTSGQVDIPSNSMGSQTPHSGIGYAGLFCSVDTSNIREYLEIELTSTLLIGQKYCVEFYVSLSEISAKATSNIGAYFSTDSLLDNTPGKAINYVVPQIANANSNILSDKNNWMKIFGVFTAQGGEKYITIGNFLPPSTTTTQDISGSIPMAYYYIDDISVVACDTNWVGVNDGQFLSISSLIVTLNPNPNNGEMNFVYSLPEGNKGELKFYDVSGRVVGEYLLQPGINTQLFINKNELQNGIYFYSVYLDSKQTFTGKVVIAH